MITNLTFWTKELGIFYIFDLLVILWMVLPITLIWVSVCVCVCESAVFILFLEHSFYTPNSHVVIYSADVLTLSLSTKHCAVTIISNKMT